MSPGHVTPLGLRERKKLQTRAAIERHALTLFAEQGFAATTIAQIAEAADVSPRTVSSYFPAKEDLVFARSAEAFSRLNAHIDSRPSDVTMATALREWVTHEAPELHKSDDDADLRRRVIAAEPELQAYAGRFTAEAEQRFASHIARDLGCDPSALEARMAAGATLAVLQAIEAHHEALQAAADDGALTADETAELLALLDRGLTFISAGIERLRADQPAATATRAGGSEQA